MTLADRLYALLFVAAAPTDLTSLAVALETSEAAVASALEELAASLEGGPVRLLRIAGGWQLATAPELATLVGAFLKPAANRLGRAMLEVLAIVAYRQPITIPEIEALRGASADYSVRGLLERRLIVECGRRRAPGRPMEYGTGPQFLHAFGLDDLGGLPALAPEATLALPPRAEAGESVT